MDMTWIQSAMMGFISGLCELLPLSAEAHRGLLRSFFGIESEGTLFLLLSHIAVLAVVLMCGKTELGRLRRANKMLRTAPRRREHQPDLNSVNTIKLLRTAGLMAVIGRMLSVHLSFMADKLYLLTVPLILTGLALWVPTQLPSANKDGRHMVPLDGTLMGLGALLSAVPGISLVGCAASAGMARGADRRYAVRFAWLLLIISLICAVGIDLLAVIGGGLELELMPVLNAALGAAASAAGAYLGIRLMFRLLRASGSGISGFCYYNWGQALLCFILFLFV